MLLLKTCRARCCCWSKKPLLLSICAIILSICAICASFMAVLLSSDNDNNNAVLQIQPHRFEFPPGRNAAISDLTEFNPDHLITSRELNLVVTWISKVMSSSIRNAMRYVNCNDTKSRCGEIQGHDATRMAVLQPDNLLPMTRVIMLRDPFERCLSAYRNAEFNAMIRVHGCGGPHECSFDEWIGILAKRPNYHFLNEHHTPQTTIAQFDLMHYHYILRISSQVDQDFFWTRLLHQVPLHMRPTAYQNNTIKPETTTKRAAMELARAKFANMTDLTVQRIVKVYRRDFVLWQQVLDRGTPPRQEGEEYTMYDYYIEELNGTQMYGDV